MEPKYHNCAYLIANSFCHRNKQFELLTDSCYDKFISTVEAKDLVWQKVNSLNNDIETQYRSNIAVIDFYYTVNIYEDGEIHLFLEVAKRYRNLGSFETLELAQQEAQKHFNTIIMGLLK